MSYIEVGPNQILAGKTISHPYGPLPVVKHCLSSVFFDSCCFSKGKMNMIRTTRGKKTIFLPSGPLYVFKCIFWLLLFFHKENASILSNSMVQNIVQHNYRMCSLHYITLYWYCRPRICSQAFTVHCHVLWEIQLHCLYYFCVSYVYCPGLHWSWNRNFEANIVSVWRGLRGLWICIGAPYLQELRINIVNNTLVLCFNGANSLLRAK